MTDELVAQPPLFVVATERHVERLASASLRAVTRQRLFERLASSLLGDVTFANPMEARLALAGASLSDDGAIGAIDATLAKLRESNVEQSALVDLGAGSGPIADRARMLARAMRELDERLLRVGLIDGRRVRELLASVVTRLDGALVAKAIGATEVQARWIVTWTPADARLWRALDAALSRAGGRAHVELASFDRRLDAERERDPLEIVWDELAQHLEEPPSQRTIEAVLGDLTLTTPLHPASLARVALRDATDARAESKAAADAIASELDKGTPIDRIAVAVLDADSTSARSLARTLRQAGVPVFDARTSTSSSLLATAREALELAGRSLERTRVAALLRSSYLDGAALTGLQGRQARRAMDDLAYALETTPTESAQDAVSALVATAAAARFATPALLELARALAEILGSVELERSRADHVRVTREVLARLGLSPRADDALKRACSTDAPMNAPAAMDVSAHFNDVFAWNALVGSLLDLSRAAERVGSHEAVPATRFRHELWREVEGRLRRSEGARANAVRLVALTELAEEDLALLVVCGATAEAIPGRGEESGMLPAALSNALRARDPLAAPPLRALSAAREMAALAWAAARAERVILCRPTHDDSGTSIAAAPLVEWLKRAGVDHVRFGAGVIADRPWTRRDRALAVLAIAPDHADSLAPEAARRARIERDREAFHHGGDDLDWTIVGKLGPDPVVRAVLESETGGGAHALGTTSLERFAACAFQGFAQSILGGREETLAEDTPTRRDEGNLAHDMLRAAFDATHDMWRERPRRRDAMIARAVSAVDKLIGERARGLRLAALRRLRVEVIGVLEASIEDVEWDFETAEREFAPGAAWPALQLGEADTRLSLTGKIDRVDLSHDGGRVRVLDYKRRAQPFTATELGSTRLQLPIYARVAGKELGRAETSGQYLLTHMPSASPPHDWAKRWDALGVCSNDSPLVNDLLEMIRSIRQGVVLPKPKQDKSCQHCGSDGVCRRPRFAIPRDD